MPKKAIIVESPTKTRTLSGFLAGDYELLASMGHVRDLPEDEMAVDVQGSFEPKYVVPSSARKTIGKLRKALKNADEIYLATDPDREGEAIAWHLVDELELSHARRIQFNEITREAVLEALEHPGEIDMDRVEAQQARRILDRLVGYSLSPVLWKKIGGPSEAGLSAGRVQSVALRLITDRERERAAFEPEEYWSISALLQPEGGEQFEAELKTIDGEEIDLSSEDQVTPIVAEMQGAAYRVAQIERKKQRRNPRPPFITSTLQRAASNRLRFSARKTMRIAQQLYEGVETAEGSHGLITYMRTDSTNVAASARKQAAAFIEERWSKKYLGKGVRGEKVKGAQEAHEAIRPTSVTRTPESLRSVLSKDQLALYELIWRRFVASQMAPAIVDQTGVDIEAGRFMLRATGQVVIFPGWYAVAGRDDDDKSLPELQEGQALELLELDPQQHFTQPPPRYTEASLVRELEDNGVGRPSTYAEIIDTLRRRRYVRMERRQFAPTPLGLAVSDYLVENFPEIMDIEFTASVEEDLDTVERGERDWREVLRDFYGPFEQEVARAESAPPRELEGERCPECGGRLLIRYSRHGKFAGCENYPDCDYTRDLTVLERPPVEETEYECPECGSPLVIRTGRRGRFFACSAFPECEYTADVGPDGAPQERSRPMPTTEECPECGGTLILREGRRGKFLGCSNFPKCRYTRDYKGEELAGEAAEAGGEAAPAEVQEEPGDDEADSDRVPVVCDECGAPMVVRRGRRGRFLGCSNYPRCKATKPIRAAIDAGWTPPEAQILDEKCPECGKPLAIREGRRGKFIGCTGYPGCRYTRDLSGEEEGGDAD
ncbi:MAG: type I DNA topoisomerase [Armatimonadota bacterium]|nr:type I DNA topoisomerase [Armatimonadota bacterium]